MSITAAARSPACYATLICLAGLLAFWNGLHVPFIFDDLGSIEQNETIRTLWPLQGALTPPLGGLTVSGRPILNLSFAVNYHFGAMSPYGYHFGNILIHLFAGLTLFGILRHTFTRFEGMNGKPETANALASAVAVIWLVHPLQTESVTYIAQRAESLCGLFYLLTIYCFIRAVSGTPRAIIWYALSVLSCALGMGTKEVMVTAPVSTVLFAGFFAGEINGELRRRWKYYSALAGTWAILAILTIKNWGRGGSAGFSGKLSLIDSLMTQAVALVTYVKLAICPVKQVFDYGTTPATSGIAVACIAIILFMIAAIAMILRRSSARCLALLFFIVLAPACLIPISEQPIAEHRMYLPLAVLIVLVICAFYRLVGTRVLFFVIGATALCCLTTIARNKDYQSKISIWRDTVEKAPGNSRAYLNLGLAYAELGDLAQAEFNYDAALSLNPDYYEAYADLGNVYEAQGKSARAAELYERALALRSASSEVLYNLANIRLQEGKLEEAEKMFRSSLLLNPDFMWARANLALTLVGLRRYAEGAENYERALVLDPRAPGIHARLVDLYIGLGDVPKAFRHCEQALIADPKNEDLRNKYAILHVAVGKK